MNRAEALKVVHEVLMALGNVIAIGGFSLDYSAAPSKPQDDFQVKINCEFDENSRKIIQPILEKRNLKLEEKKDMIIIQSL